MSKENRTIKGQPTVSIVGAGRLGGALALALAACHYSVEALVSRRLSQARRVANLLGPRTISLTQTQLARLPPSDLILIATPDDLIGSVAQQLASTNKELQGNRTVLHTSGALSSKVLSPLADRGIETGSLHPLVSISDPTAGSRDLRGAFFCVEGSRIARRMARQVVSDLGGYAFSLKPQNKALYHAAAVLASGHVTALFDIATEVLADCGVSRRRAREVLLPLLQSAVTNLARMEPALALTGTFARGDVATVARHLAVLEEQAAPAALAAYVLLGRRSLALAKQGKLTAATVNQISALLNRSAEVSRK